MKMNTTLRTIRVYGPLAKLLKRRTFKAAVCSPQEAIRFLLANYPELEGYMRPRFFQVSVGGRGIKEEDICVPVGFYEDITITPAICGAGGPVGQVITGLALITLSIFVPFVAPVLLPLGIGLTLTGVAGLISPVAPDRPESSDSRSQDSYAFNGIQQTSREGPPVPLVYGDIVTGSIVLSVKIEIDDEELDEIFDEGSVNPSPDQNPFPPPPTGPTPEEVGNGYYEAETGISCWQYYAEFYLIPDPRCDNAVGTLTVGWCRSPNFKRAGMPDLDYYVHPDPHNCNNLPRRGAAFEAYVFQSCYDENIEGGYNYNYRIAFAQAYRYQRGKVCAGYRIFHRSAYGGGPVTLMAAGVNTGVMGSGYTVDDLPAAGQSQDWR